MNQYLKIPRGINVNNTNDLIIRKTIEAIGKKYSRVLLGAFRSDYAKGKAYLSRKYGVSKTAIKKLHTIEIDTDGYNNIDPQYGNYISVHILHGKEMFENIISSTKEKNVNFLEIAVTGGYDENSKYMDALFEESFHWMNRSLRDQENFNRFNKNDNAHDELRNVVNELRSITDLIGG